MKFEIGARVRVVACHSDCGVCPYIGKVGEVMSVSFGNVTVDFGDDYGLFYDGELTLVEEGDHGNAE